MRRELPSVLPAVVPVMLLASLLSLTPSCRGAPPTEQARRSLPTQAEREQVAHFWKRYEAAEASRRAGRWAEAAATYAEALAMAPDHEGALYGHANCLLELDRHADALPLLERLVAVNPLSQRAHVQLAYLRSSPEAPCCFDLEAARAELERAVAINRQETGALMRLAEVHLALGRRDEASLVLDQVLRANSHAVGAPWLLAFLARAQGRPEEAGRLVEEALRRARGPELPRALPAEGDTRGDHRLAATTLRDKALVPPVWDGIAERRASGALSPAEVEDELARLEPVLARIAAAARGG